MSPSPPPLLSDLVDRAVELAAEWHDGTYRKGRWRSAPFVPPPGAPSRVPAMAHVTSVALMVQAAGWGEEPVAAAFLHDAIEDANRHGQRLSVENLAELMGETVARLVLAVSEPGPGPDGRPLRWRARKDGYLARLAAGPPEAAAIALADKVHNAYTMTESLRAGEDIFTDGPGRRALSAGPEAQRWFFESALRATARHADPRLDPIRARLRVQIGRFAEAAGLQTEGEPGHPV